MRLTKKIKEAVGTTAINTFLSDYDSEKSYEEIMDCLNDADTWSDFDGEVWEPFEQYDPKEVYDFIECLYDNTIEIFKGVK